MKSILVLFTTLILVLALPADTYAKARLNIENPRTVRDYHNRGNVHMVKGEYAEALQDFNTALTLDPGYIESYISRGTLHSLKQQITMAAADFDKALKLDPENIGALYSRAGLYKMQGKFHEALADYQKILEIEPRNKKTLKEMEFMQAVFRP